MRSEIARSTTAILIVPMRKLGMIALDQILVNAEALIERSQGAFKPASNLVALGVIETFGIDAGHAKDYAQIPAFSEEGLLVNKSEQPDQRAQAARFEKLFRDLADADHACLRKIWKAIRSRLAGSY